MAGQARVDAGEREAERGPQLVDVVTRGGRARLFAVFELGEQALDRGAPPVRVR